jgi:hypothetical protein
MAAQAQRGHPEDVEAQVVRRSRELFDLLQNSQGILHSYI